MIVYRTSHRKRISLTHEGDSVPRKLMLSDLDTVAQEARRQGIPESANIHLQGAGAEVFFTWVEGE